MTALLPEEIQQVFDRFVTTEYTTIDAKGQPITWPVTPYYRPGNDCIEITTGLGYPKKADDAARNRYVSLLFSDPNGSGHGSPRHSQREGPQPPDKQSMDEWPAPASSSTDPAHVRGRGGSRHRRLTTSRPGWETWA